MSISLILLIIIILLLVGAQVERGIWTKRRARPGSTDIGHPLAHGSYLGRCRPALRFAPALSGAGFAWRAETCPAEPVRPTISSGATRVVRTKARRRAAQ